MRFNYYFTLHSNQLFTYKHYNLTIYTYYSDLQDTGPAMVKRAKQQLYIIIHGDRESIYYNNFLILINAMAAAKNTYRSIIFFLAIFHVRVLHTIRHDFNKRSYTFFCRVSNGCHDCRHTIGETRVCIVLRSWFFAYFGWARVSYLWIDYVGI